jgi:aminoglycoside 6'-N-acetyltransferase
MKNMQLFTYGDLAVRELTGEDAGLLVKWLSDPQVLAFYEGRDRPHDSVLVRQHFYELRGGIDACIVQYEGRAIGYMQFYPIGEEERDVYGYSDETLTIAGMDQFIGEPAYWNRGIGTQLMTAAIDYLVNGKGVNLIVMDPQTWNERAIRCYEKSGFRKKRLLEKHERHEGELRDCWLMKYRVQEQGNGD